MQLKTSLISVGALALGLFSLSASGAPITSFSSLPVTDAGALTDDPNLAGKVENLMTVNVGNNDWTNSSIRINLTNGFVYNATNAVGTDSSPNAALWTLPTLRNGQFDTFVNSKGGGATPDANPLPATILGTLNPDGSAGPPPALGLTTNNATLVSAQWGNTTNGETGTFSVGRFTLSATATGTFFGESFDSAGGGIGVPFSGVIAGGVMALVPEPTSLGLFGLAAVALLRRRRTA